MPGTPTPRLSLPTLGGGDAVSGYPETNLTQMADLDNSAVWLTGTLAGRPTAGSVVTGTFYRATDSGDVSVTDGTSWYPLERQANKGVASGYAGLDSGGSVPLSLLRNGLVPWSIVAPTSSVTAAPGQAIITNESGPITVTLPVPSNGDQILVYNWNGNYTVTISSVSEIVARGVAWTEAQPLVLPAIAGYYAHLVAGAGEWLLVSPLTDATALAPTAITGLTNGTPTQTPDPGRYALLTATVGLLGGSATECAFSIASTSGGTYTTVATLYSGGGSGTLDQCASFVVPPGYYFKAVWSSNTPSIVAQPL